jgi:hypothetical protein
MPMLATVLALARPAPPSRVWAGRLSLLDWRDLELAWASDLPPDGALRVRADAVFGAAADVVLRAAADDDFLLPDARAPRRVPPLSLPEPPSRALPEAAVAEALLADCRPRVAARADLASPEPFDDDRPRDAERLDDPRSGFAGILNLPLGIH